MDMTIEVAKYSKFPGPRYKKDGPGSGESFREEVLKPALRKAISEGGRVNVVLDNVAGYGSSFLEEAFGGLVRSGFEKPALEQHLEILANSKRFQHHVVRAKQYIAEASPVKN